MMVSSHLITIRILAFHEPRTGHKLVPVRWADFTNTECREWSKRIQKFRKTDK